MTNPTPFEDLRGAAIERRQRLRDSLQVEIERRLHGELTDGRTLRICVRRDEVAVAAELRDLYLRSGYHCWLGRGRGRNDCRIWLAFSTTPRSPRRRAGRYRLDRDRRPQSVVCPDGTVISVEMEERLGELVDAYLVVTPPEPRAALASGGAGHDRASASRG